MCLGIHDFDVIQDQVCVFQEPEEAGPGDMTTGLDGRMLAALLDLVAAENLGGKFSLKCGLSAREGQPSLGTTVKDAVSGYLLQHLFHCHSSTEQLESASWASLCAEPAKVAPFCANVSLAVLIQGDGSGSAKLEAPVTSDTVLC
jgi:hypothetical protein